MSAHDHTLARLFAGEASVTGYMKVCDQSNASVTWPSGAKVLVQASAEHPDALPVASALAEAIARPAEFAARVQAALGVAHLDAKAAKEEAARLRADVPPKAPTRILGAGCLREDPNGRGLWLLSKPDTGWSAFGIRLDGWDDLFRRYDVVVGAPSTDAAGQWWPASPRSAS